MNCIIVDDEPVARKGMKSLVEQILGSCFLCNFFACNFSTQAADLPFQVSDAGLSGIIVD